MDQQPTSSVYQLKHETSNSANYYTTTSTHNRMNNNASNSNNLNDLELYDSSLNIEEERGHRKRIVQIIVDLIAIIIIFIIFALVYTLFDPKIRFMTCDESDIFFPYKADTIPFWAVGIYGTIGPILFIIPIELLNARVLPFQKNKYQLTRAQRWRKYFICTFHAISLFVLGIALVLCLTEIGKRWVYYFLTMSLKTQTIGWQSYEFIHIYFQETQ